MLSEDFISDLMGGSPVEKVEENKEERSLNPEPTTATQEAVVEDNKPVVEQQVEQPKTEVKEPVVETPKEPVIPEGYVPATQLDELKKQIEEAKTAQEKVFANESIKKLNELAKSGVDVDSEEFWKWQTIEPSKFDTSSKEDALALKRLELKVENPELNDSQIERLLKRSYKVLFDGTYDENDEEYKEALEDLSIDAIAARKKVVEYKNKVQLPKVDLSQKEEQEKAAQQAREAFNRTVKEQVSSYAEQPLKVGDVELKYLTDENSKKFLESSLINNQTFFQDNYVKEGNVDFARLKRDLLIIHDFPKISKMILDQGISMGREEVGSALENSNGDSSKQKVETEKDIMSQIFSQIK